MSGTIEALRKRQWVSLPGGSCDVRIGTALLDEASPIFKGAVGKPRASMLVAGEGADADACELLRRQLADAGFMIAEAKVPAGPAARTLEAAGHLMAELGSAKITSDDLVVVIGDVDVLSLGSWVCAQWCAGVPLVMVPTNQTAMIEAPITPRGLDVADRTEVLRVRPSVKHVLFDTGVALREEVDEDVLMARVHMVVTAMCDSEAAFSRLWDHAEDLCAGDTLALCEQMQDTIKLRGKVLSSTALALRQSLTYGESFAGALMRLLGEGIAPSTARAEALRFQARLAAGEGMFEIDDVLAQDELLETLGLPQVVADIDPQELIAAVREERYMRSNRFLLGLPRKLGRVRLAAVTDELLSEHVAAWCASRAV